METIRVNIPGLNHHFVITAEADGNAFIQTDFRDGEDNGESDSEFLSALDGIESLILAHYCAGVDVQSAEYAKGIAVALEKIANAFL